MCLHTQRCTDIHRDRYRLTHKHAQLHTWNTGIHRHREVRQHTNTQMYTQMHTQIQTYTQIHTCNSRLTIDIHRHYVQIQYKHRHTHTHIRKYTHRCIHIHILRHRHAQTQLDTQQTCRYTTDGYTQYITDRCIHKHTDAYTNICTDTYRYRHNTYTGKHTDTCTDTQIQIYPHRNTQAHADPHESTDRYTENGVCPCGSHPRITVFSLLFWAGLCAPPHRLWLHTHPSLHA